MYNVPDNLPPLPIIPSIPSLHNILYRRRFDCAHGDHCASLKYSKLQKRRYLPKRGTCVLPVHFKIDLVMLAAAKMRFCHASGPAQRPPILFLLLYSAIRAKDFQLRFIYNCGRAIRPMCRRCADAAVSKLLLCKAAGNPRVQQRLTTKTTLAGAVSPLLPPPTPRRGF